MNRVIVIKKCNECPHCVASATEAMELMWVCAKAGHKDIRLCAGNILNEEIEMPAWCPLTSAEYLQTQYMENAQCLWEWLCDTFHRHVTGAKVTDLSHEIDIILDSTGWADVRRQFRDIALLKVMDEAYAMIDADAKATKRIGCHDWGFTPWFAENCIVFKDSSEHFLCVTPDWKTRVENYILESQSHDEND